MQLSFRCFRFGYAAVRLLVMASCATMVGCGWQLRGTTHLPPLMVRTYVDSADRYSDFDRALRERLQASGAQLTDDRSDATAIIRVRKDQTGQRVLSVSAQNKPQEYEVYYAIEYSVQAAPDKELIGPQTLELTQDYSYAETAVLAKQREEESLRQALARDLAGLVLRRLAAL